MLPPLALDPPTAEFVVDMCSAPGGKSGFLAQLVGPQGFVLANESNTYRTGILKDNLQRMNLMNTAVSTYPGEEFHFPPGSVGSILLDPPCSGWGTVEKHPEVALWKEQKVEPLIRLQRSLLQRATELLAPGGRLVYSTCTTNPDENERQVVWAGEHLGLKPEALQPFAGFECNEPMDSGAAGALLIDGPRSEAQGFFIAAFRKQSHEHTWNGPNLKECAFESARVNAAHLDDDLLDMSKLPPGGIYRFGNKLYFLGAELLKRCPKGFRCKGFLLGTATKTGYRMHPGQRVILKEYDPHTGINLEAIEELEALVQGRSIACTMQRKEAGLYFRGLKLGRVKIKGKRMLWSDR